MNPDFLQAVEVTGVGMALVFLSLLACAAVISLLTRILKAKPEEDEGEEPNRPPKSVISETPPLPQNDLARVAAIAVALVKHSQLAKPPKAPSAEEITGEVVHVITLDPDSGTWSAFGRLQGVR